MDVLPVPNSDLVDYLIGPLGITHAKTSEKSMNE